MHDEAFGTWYVAKNALFTMQECVTTSDERFACKDFGEDIGNIGCARGVMYSKRAIANEFTEPVNTDTNVLRVLVYLSYLTVGDMHRRLGIREDDHRLIDR